MSAAVEQRPAERAPRKPMGTAQFWCWAAVFTGIVYLAGFLVTNDYVFFAGYIVLQYVLLATAWNILGGYAGYVNFGTAAFFAIGAYISVALNKWLGLPLPLLILAGAFVCGLIGLLMGGLTLKLQGVFFSIATLALAIVTQALITNWEYVGGSAGAYVIRPSRGPLGGSYVEYLFFTMLILATIAVCIARTIERSAIGYGLAAIRDDEAAAEASGVPTMKLKVMATVISGALMGAAGAPLPFFVTYLDPPSAFNLAVAVNTIAMPLVGGTATWIGPIIGAVLLSIVQEAAMVTISSAVNLLLVGLIMIGFITLAPNGIMGLLKGRGRK